MSLTGQNSEVTNNNLPAKQVGPRKRIGVPSDMSRVVVFLSAKVSVYITGVVLPVDGGVLGLCRFL